MLDLETAPDKSVYPYLRQPPAGLEFSLLAITSASLLHFHEEPENNWQVTSIASCRPAGDPDAAEEAILEFVDQGLSRSQIDQLHVVTYSGGRFDLPLLKRRAARHLRFDLEAVLAPDTWNLDLMFTATRLRGAKWPKLEYAAAGLGIPAAYQLPSTVGARALVPKERWKGELDVVTTYLLLLYELGIRRRSELPVMLGWAALADRIDQMGGLGEHLQLFARHPLAAAGRRLR